jgi:cell division protein FtsB
MAVYSPLKHQKDTPMIGRPWVVLGLGLLVLILLWSVIRMYMTYREAARLRADYLVEHDDLAARQADLEASTRELRTERGQEVELRNRYRAVRPGEQMIVVVGDDVPIPEQNKPSFFENMGIWWKELWGNPQI